jgi:colanic acid biosynthesis protein WcaH
MELSDAQFFEVIKNAPLVSFDLIIKDDEGRVLLGLRKNEPAKETWFVPGGRIRKDETLDKAFERITENELGVRFRRCQARLIGVFDAIYDNNYLSIQGVGTHYVVLAYEIKPAIVPKELPTGQHNNYRWFSKADVEKEKGKDAVHPFNYPYFDIDNETTSSK